MTIESKLHKANSLEAMRKALGWSRDKLAQLTGESQAFIYNIERRTRTSNDPERRKKVEDFLKEAY